MAVGMAYSVQRLAGDWTVRGSNPSGVEIFRALKTGHEDHQPSCTMDTGSSPGVKQPEMVLTTKVFLVSGYEWVGTIHLLPLCACTGIS
jgi:hypothetical protein